MNDSAVTKFYSIATRCNKIPDVLLKKITDEPKWHIVIGGYMAGRLNSVELFNWQTLEQCQLPNLTYPINGHSAVVFDRVPGNDSQ